MNVETRAFVDSNVLVCAVSRLEAEKQKRAREIVARGFAERCYVISTQVVFEVYVSITRKAQIGISPQEAFEYVESFLEWPVVAATPDLALDALKLAARYKISVWDAAILEAAREAGCSKVLSEDLGDGQSYRGITVVNPFVSPA